MTLIWINSIFINHESYEDILEGNGNLKTENLNGTPWQKEYLRIAPDPEDWPLLVYKVKEMNLIIPDWSAEEIQSIGAQSMIIRWFWYCTPETCCGNV